MVNIILVNYNSSQDTINCIDSIIKFDNFFQCKIKIFDNNSRAEEKNLLKEFESSVKNQLNSYVTDLTVKYNDENSGFASGNNFFMKDAESNEVLWILNNDTLVNSQLLEKISQNLPAEKEVVYMDCHTFENQFHDGGMHFVNLKTGKNSFEKLNDNYFGYICGASFLIRKTDDMPLFSEDYFLYYEDCDYGMRLKNQNYSYKKMEDCYFLHKIGGSGKNEKKKVNLITLRSQILFMKKYGTNFPFYVFVKFVFLVIFKREFTAAGKLLKWAGKMKSDSVLPNHL